MPKVFLSVELAYIKDEWNLSEKHISLHIFVLHTMQFAIEKNVYI